MPPRKIFSEETIIQTAFDFVRENGLSDLSARTLARKLNSSTTPIYYCIHSMPELRRAVYSRALDLLTEYQSRIVTGNEHIDILFGIIVFARDERILYRILYLSDDDTILKEIKVHEAERINYVVNKARLYHSLDEEEILQFCNIIEQARYFARGIADEVNVGAIQDDRDEKILALLDSIYLVFQESSVGGVLKKTMQSK